MNAAIPERRTATEEISGLIERVTFHNDENGFCVLRVKVRGRRDELTVIGSLPSVTAGEWLEAEGWWVRDKEHGLQFKARLMKTVPPTTVEGIERYLSSGLVKGIGPVLAKKLVGRFGAEVLGVIENRVAELQSVDGIGPKRRQRIEQAWQEAKQIREIMLFLHSHGVSTSRAVRIFKTYGEQAIEKVRSNPYMLAKDIYGIGFATADQIAQKIGIPRDSLDRARAGIDHVLLEATSDGHCALPLEKLKLTAVKLLEIPEAMIEQLLGPQSSQESPVHVQGDGFAQIGGVAGHQDIPFDLQKQLGQTLAIGRFVALAVQLHTSALRHLAPLTVPEQGIENIRGLNQSFLTGQEQFVKDLIRSTASHASSAMGMLRVVFCDPLPRRGDELAGQG
jgi:exodeoxyribonuclease V alpha subunit